jgi:hypothetical protein
MDRQAEIDRLRLEADTIMTRYQQVQRALEAARTESGDHWETGELPVTLDTPRGEEIEITLDFDADPAGNAQARYDRANELEAQQERERRIVGRLSSLPTDPVAYLVCYHLDRVKAKQAEEVRQHHTYYRLSRDGDHLLRFLGEREGRLNVLWHLPDGRRLVERLARDGPDAPRPTADELGMEFEYVRHLYRALHRVGLVTKYEGRGIDESEWDLQPDDGDHRSQTHYVTTDRAETVLQEGDDWD